MSCRVVKARLLDKAVQARDCKSCGQPVKFKFNSFKDLIRAWSRHACAKVCKDLCLYRMQRQALLVLIAAQVSQSVCFLGCYACIWVLPFVVEICAPQ